jgi:Catalase-related immune-responsive
MRLFYRSVAPQERKHMAMALTFELSKVQIPEIRKKMLGHLNVIDKKLGSKVADGLGMTGKLLRPRLRQSRSILIRARRCGCTENTKRLWTAEKLAFCWRTDSMRN